ncbi:hypothetical protein EDF59_15012 [Novosphingobium sp. ST904]|nr:hypothetical protein EDF59_15012 [Novosphingobium sp. ST904]
MLEVEACDLPDTGRHVDILVVTGCADFLQMRNPLGEYQAELGQVSS